MAIGKTTKVRKKQTEPSDKLLPRMTMKLFGKPKLIAIIGLSGIAAIVFLLGKAADSGTVIGLTLLFAVLWPIVNKLLQRRMAEGRA